MNTHCRDKHRDEHRDEHYMSTARVGRDREYRVRDELIARDWHPIMRAAASKGPADLLMVHPLRGGALIQVGSTSKTISPAERALFTRACDWAGLLCLLAVVPKLRRDPIRYWQVTEAAPSHWTTWQP